MIIINNKGNKRNISVKKIVFAQFALKILFHLMKIQLKNVNIHFVIVLGMIYINKNKRK